jgi:hypothetical protein
MLHDGCLGHKTPDRCRTVLNGMFMRGLHVVTGEFTRLGTSLIASRLRQLDENPALASRVEVRASVLFPLVVCGLNWILVHYVAHRDPFATKCCARCGLKINAGRILNSSWTTCIKG